MHHLLSWVGDSGLTIFAYVVNVVIAALGFEFTMRPADKGKRLRLGFFSGFVLTGCLLTREQSSRARDDGARAEADSRRVADSNLQLHAMNEVVQKFPAVIKSELVSQLASQAQAIVTGSSRLSRELKMQGVGQAATKQSSLFERAQLLGGKLQGLKRDWNLQYDKLHAELNARQNSTLYATASQGDRAELLASDNRELNWRELKINDAETKYYYENYRSAAEALRAELVPFAPGQGDVSINYADEGPGRPSYVSFVEIADDFHGLVTAAASAVSGFR